CYSFDIRQCQTDSFADTVLETSSFTSREANMKRWLDDNGFEVVELKLVLNFHEFVCEACDTCPQGDRYFIKIVDDGNVEELAEDLRLLSFSNDDCSIFG
ncbi:MAG: hypothetical protein KJN84_04735, partial [Bacteroidia bacterium]|nr:hypothetical protein [Bacteroidia bacterium]